MTSTTIDASRPLRVHVVEDDADLREDIVLLLGSAGFEVHGQSGAAEFYKAHALAPCDVAVLDIGLAGEDGLSIATQLRATGPIGIVMASARGAVDERIDALRLGADAYMVKPIHIEELVATIHRLGSRVRAMSSPPADAASPPARGAGWQLHIEELVATIHRLGSRVRAMSSPPADAASPPARGAGWQLLEGGWILCDPQGRRMKLTTNERAFLSGLVEAAGAAVEREALLGRVFGDDPDADPRRLAVIASRLRRKAEVQGMALPLHVVRGSGYQFIVASSASPAPPFG